MSSFVSFLFCFIGDIAFSEYSVSLPFYLVISMKSTLLYLVCFFLPDGVCFFYLVTTGWILTSAYVRIQSIKQSFAPRQPHAASKQPSMSFFVLIILCFSRHFAFVRVLITISVSFLYGELLIPCCTFFFRMVFSTLRPGAAF